MTNYNEIKSLNCNDDRIKCLALLPNNKLASGSIDKTIKIWDLTNYNQIQTLKVHSNSIYCLAVLPNSKLASCSLDKTIKMLE